MNNLRWLTQEEMKKVFTKIERNTEIKKSGTVITYDDSSLYIEDSEKPSIVIGSTGSGKTQSILLPQSRLAIRAGESLVIQDTNGEISQTLKEDLEKYGYKTVILNLDKPEEGNFYNPLSTAKEVYDNGDIDKSLNMLETIGYYLLSDRKPSTSDPFWENSAINYFIGLALFLFATNKERKITLNDIFDLSNKIADKDEEIINKLNELDKNSNIFINLSGIIKAPNETRGSIISVFTQKIKNYICREKLSNMMSKTDFDLKDISEEKTAVFVISGMQSYSSSLVPLFIDQVYNSVKMYNNKNRCINIFFDEFGKFNAMKDFINIINNSRSMNIRFTVFISSFLELRTVYGREMEELIKIAFGKIIYLLANDIETLNEISELCGKVNGSFLITAEELKRLNTFEAVILIPRLLPIRTKLVPDYQIEY